MWEVGGDIRICGEVETGGDDEGNARSGHVCDESCERCDEGDDRVFGLMHLEWVEM